MTAKTEIQYKPNILEESLGHVEWIRRAEKFKKIKPGTINGRQAVMFFDDVSDLWKFYYECERFNPNFKDYCQFAMSGEVSIYDANGNLIRGRYDK